MDYTLIVKNNKSILQKFSGDTRSLIYRNLFTSVENLSNIRSKGANTCNSLENPEFTIPQTSIGFIAKYAISLPRAFTNGIEPEQTPAYNPYLYIVTNIVCKLYL